jgi:hypothetical protein
MTRKEALQFKNPFREETDSYKEYFEDFINEIFDYFETSGPKTCDGCVYDDGIGYKAVCQTCTTIIRRNYTKSC